MCAASLGIMNPRIDFAIIQRDPDFWLLEAQWQDLFQKLSSPNLFLSWEWISTWWRHYGDGKEPFVILATENGSPIAIAPFYLEKQHILKIPVTVLSMMGDGEVCSEYLDMLCIAGEEKRVSEALVSVVFDERHSWDLMALDDVISCSELLRSIRSFARSRHLRLVFQESTINPYFEISQPWSEYFARFGKKTRKNYRWGLNQIGKEAEIRFIRFPEGSSFNCSEAMDDMMRLHEACWRERGRIGVFKRKRFRQFHKDIAELFSSTSMLALFFLYRDDCPVAAEYGFVLDSKFYSYQAGYDPAYKKYGVGNVMQFLTLEYFFDNHFREFDFLRGELAYKDKFADRKRHNARLLLSRGTLFGNAAFIYRTQRKAIKGAVKKLTPASIWGELRRYNENKTMQR
jgi:CelD/BcsL family acetyltransferase involved in cellulose biosynthesis